MEDLDHRGKQADEMVGTAEMPGTEEHVELVDSARVLQKRRDYAEPVSGVRKGVGKLGGPAGHELGLGHFDGGLRLWVEDSDVAQEEQFVEREEVVDEVGGRFVVLHYHFGFGHHLDLHLRLLRPGHHCLCCWCPRYCCLCHRCLRRSLLSLEYNQDAIKKKINHFTYRHQDC